MRFGEEHATRGEVCAGQTPANTGGYVIGHGVKIVKFIMCRFMGGYW